MKIPRWIPYTLLCGLIFALIACDSPAPPLPVVDRTKPPFEPPNRTQTVAFQNTSTAEVLAAQILKTEQAQATLNVQSTATAETFAVLSTATAAARLEEISAYQFFEPFDQNDLNWREEVEDNPFWKGTIAIQNGAYTWQIAAISEIFLAWSYFTPEENLSDFDVALTARRLSGPPHEACYGLLFRTSSEGFSTGSYVLSICDNGFYKLLYTDGAVGWEVLQDWTGTEAIRQDDWNLIEISARGEDFTLTINHQHITTFTDSRLVSGSVAILIDIYAQEPSQIEFDFFALQPR